MGPGRGFSGRRGPTNARPRAVAAKTRLSRLTKQPPPLLGVLRARAPPHLAQHVLVERAGEVGVDQLPVVERLAYQAAHKPGGGWLGGGVTEAVGGRGGLGACSEQPCASQARV